MASQSELNPLFTKENLAKILGVALILDGFTGGNVILRPMARLLVEPPPVPSATTQALAQEGRAATVEVAISPAGNSSNLLPTPDLVMTPDVEQKPIVAISEIKPGEEFNLGRNITVKNISSKTYTSKVIWSGDIWRRVSEIPDEWPIEFLFVDEVPDEEVVYNATQDAQGNTVILPTPLALKAGQNNDVLLGRFLPPLELEPEFTHNQWQALNPPAVTGRTTILLRPDAAEVFQQFSGQYDPTLVELNAAHELKHAWLYLIQGLRSEPHDEVYVQQLAFDALTKNPPQLAK